MRYCNQCHRITSGQPLFCNFCGRSYNVKLCPQRHPNPRSAEICSQCGSREMSTPQPRVPLLRRALLLLLALAVAVLILLGIVRALAARPELQLILVALVAAFIWYHRSHSSKGNHRGR